MAGGYWPDNLGIKTFLNGQLASNIVINTTQAATDTIDYVATDPAQPQNQGLALVASG